jgi:hypothetical protein
MRLPSLSAKNVNCCGIYGGEGDIDSVPLSKIRTRLSPVRIWRDRPSPRADKIDN